MKKIFFILGIVLIASPLFAGELYSCKDRQGNAVVTSAPHDDMTDCVLKDSADSPAPETKSTDKQISKTENPYLERERLNQCKFKCDQEEYKPCKNSCYASFQWDKNKSKWEDCYKGCKVWLDRCEDKCK